MYTQRTIPLQDAPWHPQATLYEDSAVPARVLLFYLHGGGLLYGIRDDLPEHHREVMTSHGFVILALDYPLAPAAKLPVILESIRDSICTLLISPARQQQSDILSSDCSALPQEYLRLPWFLWGRSSGGYLALLTAAGIQNPIQHDISAKAHSRIFGCTHDPESDSTFASNTDPYSLSFPSPAGIISWYGYGMLTDHWADVPNPYYNSLHKAPASVFRHVPQTVHCDGPVMTHFLNYVYARQNGCWSSLYLDETSRSDSGLWSLRSVDALPCPLFCAHAAEDPDIPFAEFLALQEKYRPDVYIAAGSIHDFDREENSPAAAELLNRTIQFIERHRN